MHLAYAAVLLLLLAAGCARVTPETAGSQPQPATPQPATPQPATPQPATPQTTAKPVAPATPQTAAKPAAPATPQPAPAVVPPPSPTAKAPQAANKVAPPVARTPAPTARAPKPAASPAAAPPVAAPPAPAAPTLDLDALKARLRATKAIGVFTKISLKNQVDDLMGEFREHYQGKATPTMKDLRQSYNLLMMKVLTLLQDDDQPLASAIVSSREAIWGLLANPTTFAALQV